MNIVCVVPTFNCSKLIDNLVKSLQYADKSIDFIFIDSSSQDGSYDLIKNMGFYVESIPSSQFNHGGTRQMIVQNNMHYDIFIFLTQDAFLKDVHSLPNLIKPFSDPNVGAVCGRQLPHADANPIARHAREFNYPEFSEVKTKSSGFGMKTVFMSNSFAAYRATALVDAGGFPGHVILSEDMYVTAKMALKGWKIAYAGNACCFHSHNYTPWGEFKRYFDIGVFHGREPWIRQQFGGAESEGMRYVLSELKYIGLGKPGWLFRSILTSVLKFVGYRLGVLERYLPIRIKKFLSMHKRFWDSEYA